MNELTTNAKIKFENDSDFIDGVASMQEMLDTWISTADDSTERKYTLTPKSAERTLEVKLTVTK